MLKESRKIELIRSHTQNLFSDISSQIPSRVAVSSTYLASKKFAWHQIAATKIANFVLAKTRISHQR